MTTITLPRRLSLPTGGPALVSRALIGLVATLLAGLLVLAGLSIGIAMATRGEVAPRVAIAGVELSGLTRAEAAQRLEARLPDVTAGTATIAVDGRTTEVSYAEVGRRYDTEAMVDRAVAVGRDGGPLDAGIARLRSLFVGTSLPVEVHAFDDDALAEAVAGVATRFSQPAVDAEVTVEGTTYAVTPAQDGRLLDADTVRTALTGILASTDAADARLELTPAMVDPEVSTAMAQAAADAATAMVAPLVLTIDGAPADEERLNLTPEQIAAWITFDAGDRVVYDALVDEAAVAAHVEGLREAIDREAVDASFALAGTGLSGVIAGLDGRSLDAAGSTERVLDALESRGRGGAVPTLALAVNVTEPALTTAQAEAALPNMRMVSSWTTYYPPQNGSAYNPNIVIPAREIDGHVLAPGEWFSFWDAIGPVTLERGYTMGGAIINGRSVANGALAGGICSTSTTVFNAALRYGLEMGERANHHYFIDRYPTGLDATVYTDGTWTQDMTFRNDTAHPVVIRGSGGTGWVRFDVWTVHDGRSVAFSNTVTTDHRSATETTQVSTDMAPGTSRRVEFPHNGFNASVTRWVYDANGGLLHENFYYSDYKTVNGITLVGPTPAAAAEAAPEEPPPAEDAPAGDAPPEAPPPEAP